MVTSADDLGEYVMALIADELGLSRKAMTLESTIEGDFGCTGSDALALMERMQKEFGIDMSGFEFNRHFSDEFLGWPGVVALVAALPMGIIVLFVVGIAARWTGFADRGLLQSGWLFLVAYVPCFLLMASLTRFLPSERARRERMIPVTVGHLVEAARTRKWPHFEEGTTQP